MIGIADPGSVPTLLSVTVGAPLIKPLDSIRYYVSQAVSRLRI
jgi:hypothetical protein